MRVDNAINLPATIWRGSSDVFMDHNKSLRLSHMWCEGRWSLGSDGINLFGTRTTQNLVTPVHFSCFQLGCKCNTGSQLASKGPSLMRTEGKGRIKKKKCKKNEVFLFNIFLSFPASLGKKRPAKHTRKARMSSEHKRGSDIIPTNSKLFKSLHKALLSPQHLLYIKFCAQLWSKSLVKDSLPSEGPWDPSWTCLGKLY